LKRSLLLIPLVTTLIAMTIGVSSGQTVARASSTVSCRGALSWSRAASLEGSIATLTGRVASSKFASSSNGSPTFLDVGHAYPNPNRLSIVIWIENRTAFRRPEVRYRGRTVCVRGLISEYNGSPEIILRSPAQITIRS
jgi:hypothetical protein